MVISEKRREQFVDETIENIFAVLSEASNDFRQDFVSVLSNTLASWETHTYLESPPVWRRWNLLGQHIVTVVDEAHKSAVDQELEEKGYTCLESTASLKTSTD